MKRTVFHEKLGHEGLVVLLGSQASVNKFGSFIFYSATNAIRQSIMEKADDIDPEWKDGARYSKAAQEVFADIAANGPRTADEFDLWTKVKHYIIRFCNKIGLKIRGLLSCLCRCKGTNFLANHNTSGIARCRRRVVYASA